jgi:hypothetical protein
MIHRLRSIGLAGGGSMFLVLTLSGVVAAASVLNVFGAPVVDPTEPAVVDTTATFEDINGDGIDDDCQTGVVENTEAALAAEQAADLNGDGQISVSEAAQSGRTGGTNCNHGGYVSQVAGCDDAAPAEATETGDESGDEIVPVVADTTTTEAATCTEDPAETAETTEPAVCEAPVAPVDETTTTTPVVTEPVVELLPNDHGKKVAAVAQDKDAVGGKNCNHGGAVSEVANDHAARDAARAAAKEARAAAKEARAAEREARAAERAAQHATKTHGKGHKH